MNFVGKAKEEFQMAAEARGPLTEPVPIPCLYLDGTAIVIDDSVARIVGWARLPDLGAKTKQRRIVVRFAMSASTATSFAEGLQRGLTRARKWRDGEE